jgi:hypothetical protein
MKFLDKLFILLVAFLVLTIILLKFIIGSEKVHDLFGIYPYKLLEIISLLSLVIMILKKSLRRLLLNLIVLDRKTLLDKITLSKVKLKFAFFNLLVLTIFCKIYFHLNSNLYFVGTDGDYQLSLNKMNLNWNKSPYYFSSNFLQGLGGNIQFPFNHSSDLGYFVGNLTGEFNKSNALTTWILLLAISLIVLARSMGLAQKVCLTAAWIGPSIIMFPSSFVMTQIPLLTPHMFSTLALNNFILAIILLSSSRLMLNILRSVLLAILITYYLISNPTFILLSVPILLIVFLLHLIGLDRNQKIREFLVIFIPTLCVGLFGGFKYLIGIFIYTSVLFFPKEYGVTPKPITATSILYSSRPLVSVLFLISLITAFWIYRSNFQSNSQKVASGSIIIFSSGISTIGLIYFFKPEYWLGPSPFYFEFMVWSLYSIFVTVFLYNFYEKITFHTQDLFLIGSHQKHLKTLSFLVISVLAAGYFILPGISGQANGRNWNFPPDKSRGSMLQYLDVLNHQKDKTFLGRFVTITSFSDDKSKRWEDLDKVGKTFFRVFDTDFRQGGLWYNEIPTLFEVNQLVTPRSHYALTRTLARKNDIQTRDFIITRNIDINYLRQIGVKYILSNEPLNVGVLEYQEEKAGLSIYLYNLGSTNYGDWYITKTESISSIGTADSFFSSLPKMSSHKGIVETPFETTDLVKPYYSKLTVIEGNYHLTASSPGKSLLVLPVEYSNCFEFKEVKNSRILKVLPVDILQIGIEFDRNLDVEFGYKFGPFKNSTCRLNDYFEFKKLF